MHLPLGMMSSGVPTRMLIRDTRHGVTVSTCECHPHTRCAGADGMSAITTQMDTSIEWCALIGWLVALAIPSTLRWQLTSHSVRR